MGTCKWTVESCSHIQLISGPVTLTYRMSITADESEKPKPDVDTLPNALGIVVSDSFGSGRIH